MICTTSPPSPLPSPPSPRTVIILLLFVFTGHAIDSTNRSACFDSDPDDNIFWPTTQPGNCSRSDPLCIAETMEIIEWCCEGQTYLEKPPTCHHLQQPLTNPCPPNFIFRDPLCILFLENTTYPPSCPYEETVPFANYVEEVSDAYPIWMPVKRNVTADTIGLLYWTEPTAKYQTSFDETYYFDGGILGKNCLLFYNEAHVEMVECSERHTGICAYQALNDQTTSYCKQFFSDILCKQSDYSPRSKCFCMDAHNSINITAVANKVEFLKPYQNFLYKTMSSDICRIGLERTQDGRFLWVHSQTSLDYTYWSSDVVFETDKPHAGISVNGWVLTDNSEDHCILYEVDVPEQDENDLFVSFDGTYVTVTSNSRNKWKHSESTTFPLIFCFTDASPFLLIDRLVIGTPNANMSYTFKPHVKGPGNYWCEGFKYPKVELEQSNSILIRNRALFPAEFVAKIRAKFIKNTNPLTDNYIGSLQTLLNLNFLNESFIPRIFAVYTVDEDNLTIIFNSHFTSSNFTDDYEEHQNLKNSLTSGLSPLNMSLLEFSSADYCVNSSTVVEGVILHWPKTDIGGLAKPDEEFCLTNNGTVVTRTCGGDFVHGGHWTEFHVECQLFYTTDLSRNLSNILQFTNVVDSFVQVVDISESYDQLNPIDIFLMSEILAVVAEHNDISLNLTTKLLDNIAKAPKNVLEEAQLYLNATDRILFYFQEIVDNSVDSALVVEDNLLVVSTQNLSGVKLQKDATKMIVTLLEGPVNMTEIFGENFENVLILSEDLIKQIVENRAKVSIIVFFNDGLFNGKTPIGYTTTKIFQTSVRGLNMKVPGNLTILYKSSTLPISFNDSCAFWNYDINNNFQNIKGSWEEDSQPQYWQYLKQCDFSGNAHFSILQQNDDKNITDSLKTLLNSGEITQQKLSKLIILSNFTSKLQPIDVNYMSEILEDVSRTDGDFLQETATIVDNLMEVNRNILKKSQDDFGATDKILTAISEIAKQSNETAPMTNNKNFNVVISDFMGTDIIGVMLENCYETCGTKKLFNYENLTEIQNAENFESILIFSNELLNQLIEAHAKFIITVYSNDAFFTDDDKMKKHITKIIGLTLLDFKDKFDGPILMLYNTSMIIEEKKTADETEESCAYWDYKPDNSEDNKKGFWREVSNATQPLPTILECSFFDTSDYTVLLSNDDFNITASLEDILNSDEPASEKLKQLVNITELFNRLLPIDIYYISKILEEVSYATNATNLNRTARIINNLMNVPPNILADSQKDFSATDNILYYVDQIAMHVNSSEIITFENFNVIIVSDLSDMTGLILENCSDVCNLTVLNADHNMSEISGHYFDAAVIFDKKLLAQLHNAQNDTYTPKVVITVYMTDAFFNEDSVQKNTTMIFGILLPDFHEKFDGFISILYNVRDGLGDACVFWNYEVIEDAAGVKGSWNKDANSKTTIENLPMCNFDHVTHFALLLSNGDQFDDGKTYQILDLITNINCCLSAFGIFGILLTGLLFEKWRQNTGNQILMNFSFAISIKMIMMYVSDAVYDHGTLGQTFCTICGAILHYALLSEFCWMLIIAILQFKRFVEVLGGRPKYILLKACVCGWIFPLLPVVCILSIDLDNYNESNVGLCYPSDLGLYLGVWLPIIIIVAINLVIFIYIIYNVCHRKTECRDTNNHEMLFQWRLALLLFFLLGLTWLFGFLAQINWDIAYVFVYLFCFAATLQGFVMFLFFIVFNKSTRVLYSHSIQLWLYSKNFKKL